MTRGALGRTYLRGQLCPKAIGELSELIADEPHRLDLRVALAEAYWRDGQYEAAEAMCQGILVDLPHCLKANLILGQIWLNTEKDEEARALLQRAQALDPDNTTAQAILGPRSPLAPRIARLPLIDEDVSSVDLPYLVDDEEVVAETAIVDGSVGARPTKGGSDRSGPDHRRDLEGVERELDRPEAEPWPLPGDQSRSTKPDRLLSMALDVQAGHRSQEEEAPESSHPGGTSLPDVQRRDAEEHPRYYWARFRLARRLRDIGDIDGALEQYAYLVEHDPDSVPDVCRDLELLNRLHPGNMALVALLLTARDERTSAPMGLEQQ